MRLLSIGLLSAFFLPGGVALAQKNFGFDNRKPSGQPYLDPQETVKRFKMAPGWEAKLVAGEPHLINPIAFTIDERGRIWVVECFEYPSRTPKGKKPRDRIKIIEETPNGPKVTIWAEGKDLPIGWDLASGIEIGHGGVFLGAPPYLFFIENKNDKPGKQHILLKGFGSQDTHETLNTFQWGPDCKLYGLHGVFTQSNVTPTADAAGSPGVKMNAAVWRYDVHTKNFEIFAEGTSNPWGMDFDQHGNCFLACCVIPHLFHIVPGGIYRRQAGVSFNPYAFGELKEICDHTHHKQSGWAHAGLICLDGTHVPKNYHDSVLMGSIHGCSIKRDSLRPNGSSFIARCEPDLLVSGDKNFRPINLRWGPDGSIYCIDWHDQNPCHQAAPDSWDKERGRIYKFHPKPFSAEPQATVDLGKKTSAELVDYFKNDNPYYYRTALRLLSERKAKPVARMLLDLYAKADTEARALRGLWALSAVGALEEALRLKFPAPPRPTTNTQTWSIRLAAETNLLKQNHWNEVLEMALREKSPVVRRELASAARRLSESDMLPLIHNLFHHEDNDDPMIPFLLWLAYEPRVVDRRDDVLKHLKDESSGSAMLTREIVPRVLRRLATTGNADDLNAGVAFLGQVRDVSVRKQALEGLLAAFKNRQADAPTAWKKVFPALLKDPDTTVVNLARKLAVHFQDPQAIARALQTIGDATQSANVRIDALRDIALARPNNALPVLQKILTQEKNTELRAEVLRTLASFDDTAIAASVIAGWKSYPPLVRGEAVNLLSSRKEWAKPLLLALGNGGIPRTDVSNNPILRIRAFKDAELNELIEKHWGHYRETPASLQKLISQMHDVLHKTPASFARGKLVFDNQCAKCHKFAGKGHDVGPNLDGAARDIDYLLTNVLDPNRVIGAPYYVRSVELKNGRVEIGLLVAQDEQSITLKMENNVVKNIQMKDIEGKVNVHEKSVMPEGLANNMTPQDLADLVRYLMAHPFVTHVMIAGPLDSLAEPDINPARPLPAKASWKKIATGPHGRIVLPKAAGMKSAYVAADVTASTALKTRLLLGSVQPMQAWLNGRKIYSGRPAANDPLPDQAGIDVELRPGVNRLLFHVQYQGDNEVLYVRFLDPDRKLTYLEAK